MDRDLLKKKIYEASYLQGDFLLRSGKRSTEYFDKYRFESKPELLKAIARGLAKLLPPDIDFLAGLEMGGIPIATALSFETGLPVIFVRKKAKDYGTCNFAEGADFKGKKLCIIEDVVTTGGQVVLSTDDLRKAGAIVNDVLCVIYRGEASTAAQEPSLLKLNLKLKSLFTMNELKS